MNTSFNIKEINSIRRKVDLKQIYPYIKHDKKFTIAYFYTISDKISQILTINNLKVGNVQNTTEMVQQQKYNLG